MADYPMLSLFKRSNGIYYVKSCCRRAGALKALYDLDKFPPRKEQDRIQARSKSMLETSDGSETKLTHTQSAAERLVEAVVRGVVGHNAKLQSTSEHGRR